MNIGDKLSEAISSHIIFTIPGINVPVTDTVIVMWIIMVVLITLAYILTRKMKEIPEGKQNVVEIIVEAVNNLTKNSIGHHWKHFAPYIGTILLFLVTSNMISLFNFSWSERFGIKPPTKDLSVTVCMAIISMVVVIGAGIRFKKLSGWMRSFIEPVPVVLPMKILEYFVRPLSLALRLFGNILGAFIVMELLYFAMPAFIPAPFSIFFDLFDGILQAYVFVFLTSLYIAEAIE